MARPSTGTTSTLPITVADSKKINDSRYPCIIVSSNGMAMGGRIQHHLLQRLPDPRNLVLFIGFQAVGTRGRQIKDGAPEVKIFGQIVPVRAQVAALEQFSDHADAAELLQWLQDLPQNARGDLPGAWRAGLGGGAATNHPAAAWMAGGNRAVYAAGGTALAPRGETGQWPVPAGCVTGFALRKSGQPGLRGFLIRG